MRFGTKATQASKGDLSKDGQSLLPIQQYYMTPRTAIFSLIYGTQDESRHICSNYSSYLPEYTLATADTIQAILNKLPYLAFQLICT